MDVRRILIAALFVILTACADSSESVEVTRATGTKTPPVITTPTLDLLANTTRHYPETRIVTVTPFGAEPPEPKITFDGYSTRDALTLDPQLAVDAVSIDYVENLFVQLTNYDPVTAEIVPEAAEGWEISENGRLYIFHLRTDIPWLYLNPVSLETTQEIDGEGNPRFVTAHDFVYAIQRACTPEIGKYADAYYSSVIAPLITGCEAVLNSEYRRIVPQELLDNIGVQAVDDTTLTIELNSPASHFLSMTPMAIMSATPAWAIEEYEESWIEAGNIVTNGRYLLAEWVHGARRTLIRNPYIPKDMQGTGNIEQHIVSQIPYDENEYILWLDGEVDFSAVPEEEIDAHLEAYPDQTIQIPNLDVFFISFQTTIPPFDSVHVRRAFSAALDRKKYIDEWRQGQGLPMKHLAPPGIFGAPPIDEIGVGFDPEFARTELAAAGYPNCEGFPQVTLAGYPGQTTLIGGEFALEQWREHLGCTKDQILFTQPTLNPPIPIAQISDEDGYHMFIQGWSPNYADQNNWVGDLLRCDSDAASTERTCSEIDDLLIEASQEAESARRAQLYHQIEEAFFGPEGEFPIMPIFASAPFYAVQPWYDYTPVPFFGDQWYNDSIDMEMKEAAQN